MITLDHIKTLSSIELRIVLYLNLKEKTLTITQGELAKELNCNVRSVRDALRSLNDRGIILYKPSFDINQKSQIIYQ